LRACGQLTELRAADLRFTSAEAAEFLNQMMGLNLSAENIAALETRTEGWVAGLQLAALSMQGRASRDAASFIKSFTGSHHFILDYLVEEVLQRQPEHVRNFLLQTAILDRLSSPLCDAVTGQEDGRGMLEALERGNLFVIPLDDQRQWYRYHHLFAEVLQAHLREAQPDRASTLHLRASEWYEQNGLRLAHAITPRKSFQTNSFIKRELPPSLAGD
jgi:LuxR family maltose regulon positive regulatory protein